MNATTANTITKKVLEPSIDKLLETIKISAKKGQFEEDFPKKDINDIQLQKLNDLGYFIREKAHIDGIKYTVSWRNS